MAAPFPDFPSSSATKPIDASDGPARREPVADVFPDARPPSAREFAPAPPRARVAAMLGALPWSPMPAPDAVVARAMEVAYIDWAAGVARARDAVFGAFGASGYAIDRGPGQASGESVLPSFYPARSGGAPASVEDRRARLATWLAARPGEWRALVPAPTPVRMQVVGGRKRYSLAASMPEDLSEAYRHVLSAVQGALRTPRTVPESTVAPRALDALCGVVRLGGPPETARSASPRDAVLACIDGASRVLAGRLPEIARILGGQAAAPSAEAPAAAPAYLLQPAAPDVHRDLAWQVVRTAQGSGAFDLGAALDRWRDDKQRRLLHEARNAQGLLSRAALELQRSMAGRPEFAGLFAALRDLQAPGETALHPDALRRASAALQAYAGDPAVGVLARSLDLALAATERHAGLLRWLAAVGADTVASPTNRVR